VLVTLCEVPASSWASDPCPESGKAAGPPRPVCHARLLCRTGSEALQQVVVLALACCHADGFAAMVEEVAALAEDYTSDKLKASPAASQRLQGRAAASVARRAVAAALPAARAPAAAFAGLPPATRADL
jgi:hypothetical protein